MKIYLRILAGLYLAGFFLHFLDVFDLRLTFSEMSTIWEMWILYLMVFDLVAAVGLWRQKRWGVAIFILVAISQLIAYIGFSTYFGPQLPLIIFHISTLAVYFIFKIRANAGLTRI